MSSTTRQRRVWLAIAVEQLSEYFAGERTEFDLPLDPMGTPFQQSAWHVLRTIPYGAHGAMVSRPYDGRSDKARAVGAANGRNPIGIIVPCHRVVGVDGSLTGFAGGSVHKAWLLDHERRSSTSWPTPTAAAPHRRRDGADLGGRASTRLRALAACSRRARASACLRSFAALRWALGLLVDLLRVDDDRRPASGHAGGRAPRRASTAGSASPMRRPRRRPMRRASA